MEKVLGIVCAMQEEFAPIEEKIKSAVKHKVASMEFLEGALGKNRVVLAQSGMGKVCAAACSQILITKFGASALLNVGVAGALSDDLKQGDLVVSSSVVHHDFDTSACGDPVGFISRIDKTFFDADENLISKAKAAAQYCNVFAKEGLVATGDQFVTLEARKKIVKNFPNAVAAEMEGAAVAQTAWLNGVPFVILRAISDSADGNAAVSFSKFKDFAAKRSADIAEKFAELW